MTPISPVAESEILLSSLHRQLKAVADHPEHYWIGQILLDTLKRETGYTADARPSDPAQEPEAVGYRYRWKIDGEWTSWRVSDRSQMVEGYLPSLEEIPLYTRPISLDREAMKAGIIATLDKWWGARTKNPAHDLVADDVLALIEGRT